MATDSDRLVAHSDSHVCDRSVGPLFLVGEMFAEFRVVVLLFSRYLRHHWYGDLVLPKEWRMLGPIEGFTGILMFGLSTAFFFIVVSKSVLHQRDERSQT